MIRCSHPDFPAPCDSGSSAQILSRSLFRVSLTIFLCSFLFSKSMKKRRTSFQFFLSLSLSLLLSLSFLMCPPSMSSPLLRSRMASSGGKAPASSSGAAAAPAAQASRNLRSVSAAAAASPTSGSQQPPPHPPPQKRKRSLVARLGQSFNPSGIALFGKILLVRRSI